MHHVAGAGSPDDPETSSDRDASPEKPRAQHHATNKDLPDGTRIAYKDIFLPRLFEKMGGLESPWDTQSFDLAHEIETLWREVFPHRPLGYVVKASTPVYRLVRMYFPHWRTHSHLRRHVLDPSACLQLALWSGRTCNRCGQGAVG